MKFRKNKKGFTIVELIIVIAVIGVLTAVMVPTIVHLVGKANKASDNALVSNLNKALALRVAEKGKKPATMHEAVEGLEEYGYKLDALVAKSDQALLYNLGENKFVLADDESVTGHQKEFWRIQDNAVDQTYNIYASSRFGTTAEALEVSFDAGFNQSITSIKYVGEKNALIRSYGDQSVVEIDAEKANVDFYGFAKEVKVLNVFTESLHIYGATNSLKIVSGHVEVEETGIVFGLDQLETTGSVDSKGYIASVASGITVPEEVKVGGDYEIDSLERLESFRDAVNAGKTFAGLTAKLTSNIELSNGWKPIGEGARGVVADNTLSYGAFFRGTFDGNGKTISNLNNKGFTPRRWDSDNGYAYGLFALVGDGATLKNVTLTNVQIDTTSFNEKLGDSVGALLGYGEGSITITDVTVEGSVKANDGVGGVAGRIYAPTKTSGEKETYTVTIKDCSNSANVTAMRNGGGKAAGILGMIGDVSSSVNAMKFSAKGCTNSGAIYADSNNIAFNEANPGILGFKTIHAERGSSWEIVPANE